MGAVLACIYAQLGAPLPDSFALGQGPIVLRLRSLAWERFESVASGARVTTSTTSASLAQDRHTGPEREVCSPIVNHQSELGVGMMPHTPDSLCR